MSLHRGPRYYVRCGWARDGVEPRSQTREHHPGSIAGNYMAIAALPTAHGDMASRPVHTTARSTVAQRDLDLILRITQRDETALEQLYQHYAPLLRMVLSRLTGQRADAEEVAMDVLGQAWREADRFEQARGSAAVWLTMIARSRALDWLRAQAVRTRSVAAAAREVPEHAPAMGGSAPLPGDGVDQEERRRAVQAALGALPVLQRLAIELAYYGGLSQSEIAERLGEPLGTIKTRMRLGMLKLREALQAFQAE
jgi:RNA polymerase sigma-70 factor, ECF subfamily